MSAFLSRPVLIGAAAVAAVAAAAWVGLRVLPAAGGDFDVEVVETTVGDVRRVVATSGAVRALVTVEVGSQLSGQILGLEADFNTVVSANDVIARLDPQTYETRVREAEASVVVAQSQVEVQRANVSRAQANLRRAENEYERAEELVARGTTSEAAYDTSRAAAEAARADLQVAEAGLINAEASLGQRQAALDSARIDLERTVIRSPIDGIVVSREVDVGQTVAASMQAPILFTIAEDLTRVQIDAQVDEADIGQVRDGQPVGFTVDAYPDLRFEGAVDQIRLAPTADQNVVTYTVVISAANPGRRLLPGMTANLDIVTGARSNVLTVDNRAIRFEPRGSAESLLTADGRALLERTRDTAESPGVRGPGGPSFGGGGAGGPSGGRGGEGGMIAEIRDELDLTDEQVEQIESRMRTTFASIQAGGEPDFAAMRERMRSTIEAVLTDEQKATFNDMQLEVGDGPRRSGRVWVQTASGALDPRRVILGVDDGGVSEVIGGDLEEGERVVVRVRERTS